MDASSRRKQNVVPPIVRSLDDIIGSLSAVGLKETADLLRIGRLDLLMRLNGITAEEIEQLAATLARKENAQQHGAAPRSAKMPQIRS